MNNACSNFETTTKRITLRGPYRTPKRSASKSSQSVQSASVTAWRKAGIQPSSAQQRVARSGGGAPR